MNTIDKEPERHEIEVLLPWYAAGTLSRCDADLVERALARDSELARRYDVVRQKLAETIQLNEALGASESRRDPSPDQDAEVNRLTRLPRASANPTIRAIAVPALRTR
jgi:anti-sigma-K factor RskA